jgi:hypothetical protein
MTLALSKKRYVLDDIHLHKPNFWKEIRVFSPVKYVLGFGPKDWDYVRRVRLA